MEPSRWNRIQEIYYSALAKERLERSAFVASACHHDPVLLREVNLLLEADESSSGFLETPVFEIGLRIIGSVDSSSQENLIGTTIDERYLLETELGPGGIGKVYLARDLELHNRPVVIKILPQALLQDAYVVRKFQQEVEALSRIDHPGVVGLLGAGKLVGGEPYIVMQYVSGVTLRSQISSEGMDLERAASILKQIGAALDHVHEKGILHRDLKPENIMLQVLNNGRELVKIVDFGIARVKDSTIGPSTVTDVPIGTLVYMSPEQLRGRDKITAASDIYAMAVIAYEIITGRRPFTPASGAELLEMQRAGVRVNPRDLRTNLSTEAQAIILHALSFEPPARYQSAGEFGDSLARALKNKGKATRSSRTEERRQIRWPKKRLIVSSVLISVIFVAVLLGLYSYRKTDEPSPGPTRSFSYWLTLQKMRDGKPYHEPFQSNGQETFENGDKFRLNVSSPDPGYIYLFNEGPPEPGGNSFTIVYPTPVTNNGSATLGANQPIQTGWITFRGPPGAENFWIVWSTSPISELESAKSEAFKNPDGGLTDQNLVAIKTFLNAKQAEIRVRTTRYKSSQVVTVRGASDMLVTLAQFSHR